jgi:hypothetical protein
MSNQRFMRLLSVNTAIFWRLQFSSKHPAKTLQPKIFKKKCLQQSGHGGIVAERYMLALGGNEFKGKRLFRRVPESKPVAIPSLDGNSNWLPGEKHQAAGEWALHPGFAAFDRLQSKVTFAKAVQIVVSVTM